MKKLLILFIISITIISCSSFGSKDKNIITPDEVLNAVETDNTMLLNNFFASDFPIGYVNKEGKSLLIIALENDSQKVLNMLLGKGVYLEETFEDGKTPIFYVRSLNALEQMVKAGADINKKDSSGKTLLSYFIEAKPLSYSKYLTEQGADVNAVEENDWTPVFRAAAGRDISLLEAMKNNGGNFTKQDLAGNFPIYYAQNEEILLKLLDSAKYNLNAKNKKEENILGEIYLRAVSYNYVSVIEKLLEVGVNPNYMSYGDSALSIARDNRNESMIKYLNSKGIK
ncbi:ankyrin repeat domain-containing protein [Fusobacterium varium]|uniref:ankyrin repeat domain-containing protein n=1 Tax=Fusobacterium varium TaxID=856 RepID=UPI000E40F692|nr:ankyrin repeat domain-containing protein [Fusobacterium varium]MCF2673951.1 ankyrin repeat domain-containing protein [Fusobacterium varium]MCI6034084.1 ankyrin repeat domain-containing protein [Fusobacterium varium]RGJ26202.1 ankyrin repeat domain-containing protein [Fusobacterium varium]